MKDQKVSEDELFNSEEKVDVGKKERLKNS